MHGCLGSEKTLPAVPVADTGQSHKREAKPIMANLVSASFTHACEVHTKLLPGESEEREGGHAGWP